MKIRSKIIYIVLLVSVFFASCKDSFLDRPALSEIMSDQFYKSGDDLKKATASLYGGALWGAWSSEGYLPFGDVMSGNMVLNYNPGAIELNNFSTTGLNPNIVTEWRTMYNLIAHSNTTIHAIEELASGDIPEREVNAAIAEARFIRAYAYFNLAMLWGDVPIIEDNRELFDSPLVNKNFMSNVYRFVANDLTYASKNLPVTGDNWETGRVTTWSAQGLLAKVYLTWAGFLGHGGTRDQALLDSARLYAGNVCKQSGLSLLDDYADVFKLENNDNEESLFALQWTADGAGWYNGNMLQLFSGALEINGIAGYYGIQVTYDMYLQYSENDLRRKATFMFKGDTFPELNTNKGGLIFSGSSGLKKHIVGNEIDLSLPLMTNTSSPEHTILLRLADIYLVYAEAILGNSATTSDADALFYFNQIRKRAGLDPVSSIDADMLLKERRIELAAEGEYWFDLVRLSYYNPSKAIALLNGGERVPVKIDDDGVATPDDPVGVITPATIYSFRVPIPSVEATANPYLLEPAIQYQF